MNRVPFFILLVCCISGFAQIVRNADVSLEIGYSARQLSLGNSGLGGRQNVFDFNLNPALISGLSKQQVGYTHNNHFGGIIQLDNIGFSSPISGTKLSYATSIHRLQNTQAFDSRAIIGADGDFDFGQLDVSNNNDFGLKFVLGKKLDSLGVDLGTELGLDLVTVENFSRAFSFGLDLGMNMELDSISTLSVVIENVLGRYYFWNQSVSQLEDVFLATDNYIRLNSLTMQLPYLRLGINRFLLNRDDYKLNVLTSMGVGYGRDSRSLLGESSLNISPSLGFEGSLHNVFYVRTSVSSFEKSVNGRLTTKPSVGLGVNYLGVRLDYAVSNFFARAIPLQQHVISLNYSFNAKSKLNSPTDNPSRY